MESTIDEEKDEPTGDTQELTDCELIEEAQAEDEEAEDGDPQKEAGDDADDLFTPIGSDNDDNELFTPIRSEAEEDGSYSLHLFIIEYHVASYFVQRIFITF